MSEEIIDRILKINTSGRKDSHADTQHHPYEATPYEVLDRLIESGYLDDVDSLIDYGCGKGRAALYISYKTGIKTTGIEYDTELYSDAEENRRTSGIDNASFVCENAENYEISGADAFYFFNPFSSKILSSVLNRIEVSYYDDPRGMYLFFYYPDDDYLSLLMTHPLLMSSDEIDCRDLFEKSDPRERILVFEIY